MTSKDKNVLKHYGILGMRWGHRKSPEKVSNSINVRELNAKILKKNPGAAVINWDNIKKDKTDSLSDEEIATRDARRKKIRNVAIGVGLGLGVAAGAYIYATHKKEIDGALKGALDKVGNKKIKDLEPQNLDSLNPLDPKRYNAIGLNKVKTKQDAINANWIASWTAHDQHRYDEISEEVFNNLDDNDLVLKPGQVIKRISMDVNERIKGGPTYVSFDEDDANRYTAVLPAMRKVNMRKLVGVGVGIPHYSIEMKSLGELKSPSAKKRVQILIDLLEKDSEFKAAFKEEMSDLNTDPITIARKNYYKLATGLSNKDSGIAKIYFSEVKRRGYNALTDDNDYKRLTRNPLIVLDTSLLKVISSKRVTRADIAAALSKIKPMEGETWENTNKLFTEHKNVFEKLLKAQAKDAVLEYFNALYG